MSRSSRLTLFVGAACAVLLALGLLFIPNRHASLRAATVSVDKTPPVAKPAATATPDANLPAAVAPPGTILYAAKKGDTVPGLLHKFLWQSTYMTGPEFEAAIRDRNASFKGVFLKAGQNYIIPGMDGLPATEKPVVVPRDYEVRAIYLTGLMAASTKGVEIVKQWRK
ncbi:MAG TPA: hypothetical protein VH088_05135, partial [Terriglobales bacterium]|nr:hypothetical protein [Terriglobales bacterium]